MDHRDRKQWIIEMNDELARVSKPSYWGKRSIYRIPAFVTDLNPKAYQPQLVSIGPYHHGSANLQPMETHKRRAMLHFVKRSRKPLESFFDALDPLAEELKAAYGHLEGDPSCQMETDAFLEIMIVDGCFLLEILRITSESYDQSTDNDGDDRYGIDDPIFSEHGKQHTLSHVHTDMLMLENQLPLIVLEKLFSLQNDEVVIERGKNRLIKLILGFLMSQYVPKKKRQVFDNSLHILDIYRKSLIMHDPPPSDKPQKARNCCWGKKEEDYPTIRSATDLKEAGIVIKKSKTSSLKDISFKNGILRLPFTEVDDGLESLYLNLIAFECGHVGSGHEVSSYVCFMDDIIDSSKDVNLLCSRRVMRNSLGSEKAVALLFNSLSKNVTLDDGSELGKVRKLVDDYYREPWHKWRANLVHTYFTNPWVGLSVIAAFFLFSLTAVQTVYTVLGYYKQNTASS